MSGQVTPQTVSGTAGTAFTCLTGFIRRAEPVGFIQRGTHRLIDVNGNVIASLRSTQVNLSALEGRFVTVCGFSEGQIEGVLSLRVTEVFPVVSPPVTPVPQIDLRTLLLLILLTNPNLLRGLRTDLLLILLLSTGLFGSAPTTKGSAGTFGAL